MKKTLGSLLLSLMLGSCGSGSGTHHHPPQTVLQLSPQDPTLYYDQFSNDTLLSSKLKMTVTVNAMLSHAISGISPASSDSDALSISDNTCKNATIAPGASCTFYINAKTSGTTPFIDVTAPNLTGAYTTVQLVQKVPPVIFATSQRYLFPACNGSPGAVRVRLLTDASGLVLSNPIFSNTSNPLNQGLLLHVNNTDSTCHAGSVLTQSGCTLSLYYPQNQVLSTECSSSSTSSAYTITFRNSATGLISTEFLNWRVGQLEDQRLVSTGSESTLNMYNSQAQKVGQGIDNEVGTQSRIILAAEQQNLWVLGSGSGSPSIAGFAFDNYNGSNTPVNFLRQDLGNNTLSAEPDMAVGYDPKTFKTLLFIVSNNDLIKVYNAFTGTFIETIHVPAAAGSSDFTITVADAFSGKPTELMLYIGSHTSKQVARINYLNQMDLLAPLILPYSELDLPLSSLALRYYKGSLYALGVRSSEKTAMLFAYTPSASQWQSVTSELSSVTDITLPQFTVGYSGESNNPSAFFATYNANTSSVFGVFNYAGGTYKTVLNSANNNSQHDVATVLTQVYNK